MEQGAKKIILIACHSGKLKLHVAFTSPEVISTSPKSFLTSPAELISEFFCYSNSSKNITCPLGKLKTEFTSLIAKSTSHGLSDTTFFACCGENNTYLRTTFISATRLIAILIKKTKCSVFMGSLITSAKGKSKVSTKVCSFYHPHHAITTLVRCSIPPNKKRHTSELWIMKCTALGCSIYFTAIQHKLTWHD